MKTINFLQYGREPEEINNDIFSVSAEHTGSYFGDDEKDQEWEMSVFPKGDTNIYIVLTAVKDFYDFDVFSILEDGKVIETDETIRYCHLCGGAEENKYCVNETCAEYTKHEILYCDNCEKDITEETIVETIDNKILCESCETKRTIGQN